MISAQHLEVASFAIICLLNGLGVAAALIRWRQAHNVAFIGLAVPLAMMTISYAIFTYNQYHGLSNSPYRYLLRFVNGAMPVSIIAMCWLGWTQHRRIEQKISSNGKKQNDHQ